MKELIVITVAMAMGACVQSAQINGNLTAITWKHAVNSYSLLQEALASDADMIEADIIYGFVITGNSNELIPVMGHPPNDRSDISLADFLANITNHNAAHPNRTKGVKLDFKSTAVFLKSTPLLEQIWSRLTFPIWINADIIPGPVHNTLTDPVDPDRFLRACQGLPQSTLSIGWTTRWGSNFTDGSYTAHQVGQMLEAITNNNINNSTHPITFPVRAGIAAHSLPELQKLLEATRVSNNSTLTIWSSPNDAVNIDKLRNVIFTVGLDRVYIDVPDEVYQQLDLNNARGRASSLIHFSIVSASMLLLSMFLSNRPF